MRKKDGKGIRVRGTDEGGREGVSERKTAGEDNTLPFSFSK